MKPHSRRWYTLVAAEFAFVALLFWLDMHRQFALHRFAVLLFSKTPWLVLLAAISVKLDGRGWRALGWRRPVIGWPRVFAIGVAAGIAMEALELFLTQPLLERWLHQPPDLKDVASIAGNTPLLLVALALTWTLGPSARRLPGLVTC